METVLLSSSSVFHLKRIYLNLLSGDKTFTKISRSSYSYKSHLSGSVEKFLCERGWKTEESFLVYTSDEEMAKNSFLELCQSKSSDPVVEIDEDVDVDEKLLEKISVAMRKEIENGLWKFPCVFRMKTSEFIEIFCKGCEAAKVEKCLEQIVHRKMLSDCAGEFKIESKGRYCFKREE